METTTYTTGCSATVRVAPNSRVHAATTLRSTGGVRLLKDLPVTGGRFRSGAPFVAFAPAPLGPPTD